LAVRVAELRFIRSRTSAERFRGSSFEAEWIATAAIVKRLYPEHLAEFESETDRHLSLLREGRAYLFDQIPPPFFAGAFL